MELKLTPKVLFRAISAVAAAIGKNCEASMMRAAVAASAEEAGAPPADVDLRDYFAAQALPAILAVPEDGIQAWAPSAKGGGELTAAQAWAANAYEIADAMLAERAK